MWSLLIWPSNPDFYALNSADLQYTPKDMRLHSTARIVPGKFGEPTEEEAARMSRTEMYGKIWNQKRSYSSV